MIELTLVTHVYNAQEGIDHQLAHWKSFDPKVLERMEFVVVDDFSDRPLRIDKGPLALRLFRVEEDIDWNMPGCRNLAAIHARGAWVLFFDVDQIVSQEHIRAILEGLAHLDPARLYVFRRMHDGVEVDSHINTYLITRQAFFTAGGYDEDFAGHYGFDDVLFRNLCRKHVGTEVLLKDIVFQQLHYRTNDLNRDTTHNQALVQFKAALGFPRPRSLLRFAWAEVQVAQ